MLSAQHVVLLRLLAIQHRVSESFAAATTT